jgi:hypothetical protein
MTDLEKYTSGLMEAIAPVIRHAIAAAVAPVVQRLDALEAKQAAWRYCGVWQRDEKYVIGNSVTENGSVWIAKRDSQGQRPGTTDHFQLAVRKGADGKDAAR